MTKEQIKEKAKDFVSKIAGGTSKEMDYYANILAEFAIEVTKELEKENAELRKVAEFQQSSNMNRHFENKKLKEGLAVGSTFNKALNSMNKTLEEERDKYRNMVFDKGEQLTKATEIIKKLYAVYYDPCVTESDLKYRDELFAEIKQFIKESEVEK